MILNRRSESGNSTTSKRESELMLRFYLKRSMQLLDALSDRQFTAYFRILIQLVDRRGELPDDDALLASIAHLKADEWQVLRHLLIDVHRIARVDNGYWIDDDQHESIEYQLDYKERQRATAKSREAKRAAMRVGGGKQ